MVANHLTGVGAGTGSWRTPGTLYQTLNRRWSFNFDAWADHDNALAKTYATETGTYRGVGFNGVVTEAYQISNQDGFAVSWRNRRVFGNPPFTRGLIDRCIAKFIAEVTKPIGQGPECAVYIVPSAPDTQWYQDLKQVAEITELPRRVRFIHPPFECGDKCQTGKVPHEFLRPLKSPPGPMVIAEARIPTSHWREILSA